MYVCTYVHTYASTYVCMYVCMYACINSNLCVFLHLWFRAFIVHASAQAFPCEIMLYISGECLYMQPCIFERSSQGKFHTMLACLSN